ncbi:MAG TPA: hypothetical protein VKR54_00975 [Candidatus Babeliales bacterium]|jgi:hypothetical protein|nr:hypothetical protein [Candidatus Babeliales bacterium]
MNNIIHRIIFITLLLITQISLFAMELVPFQPSNSSSEMYFLINNITPQYAVPVDTKKDLLKIYIAITNDERIASHKYDEIINIPDYMNLNKHHKCYIQELFGEYRILDDINNKKMVILTAINYQKMLKLPQSVRRKIADRYSPMIIVMKSKYGITPQQATNKEIIEAIKSDFKNACIMAAMITILEYLQCITLANYFFTVPLISLMLGFELLTFTKVIYNAIHLLTRELIYRYHKQLLSLLPEDDTK